ncbi:uncharacterized protein LOC125235268 [Leguminivora glycinivorella]|uniref:uncharacterized protein LOC125235268 n=1 Tax=Leguminivora glycinivorella TaxID=1035111 RepID=UPI00201044B4|nr:uncharacterized protein LOC125235268 [Leguminivora glycinivorella]
MGLAGVKNDVKTLFLIIITLVGLLPGFLSLSFGLSYAITYGSRYGHVYIVVYFVIGVLFLTVTALGYCGAIKENRIMLYVFSGIMAVSAAINLVSLCLVERSDMTVAVGPVLNIFGAIPTGIVIGGDPGGSDTQGQPGLRPEPATYSVHA